jgi:hypothetical protein
MRHSLTLLVLICQIAFANQVFGQVSYGPFFAYSCDDTYQPIGGTSVSSITSNPAGLTLIGQKIVISGTFTIDANLTLVNCKVKFENNGRLLTSGNVRINAANTVFASCDMNWGGISMSSGSGFKFQRCLFRDVSGAAIRINGGYQPVSNYINRIIDCVFVNCAEGVYASGQIGGVSLGTLGFSGNKFLKERDDQIPTNAPFQNMNFGIHLVRCNGIIGGSGPINLFDFSIPNATGNQSNVNGRGAGVFMHRSNVRIANCRFQNAFRHVAAFPASGHGVFATGSNLLINTESGYNKCFRTATLCPRRHNETYL